LDASGADAVAAGWMQFRGDALPTPHEHDVLKIFLGRPAELGLLANHYGGPTVLWRRELLDRVGGFTPSALSEDWEILSRATLAGARVAGVPGAVYWYRQAPGGRFRAHRL